MKEKVLKLKLDAEKLEKLKSVSGGKLCCHETGSGCYCEFNPDMGMARVEIWLARMEAQQVL